MSIATVTRELLVRYLDTWAPAAVRARRATYVAAWSGPADHALAEAALRALAEFADRLRGRRLTMVVLAPETAALDARLSAVAREAGVPPELSVHALAGEPAAMLPAALAAATAAGAPLLACLDLGGREALGRPATLAALAAGRPAEILLLTEPDGWAAWREALGEAGFPLVSGVELVDDGGGRLLGLATGSARSLEAFKDELWALDEYAGVRLRDPRDPDGELMDISLAPNPAPLRRELLAHLAAVGERSVTQLRHFTLTDTVYRAGDTNRALTALLTAGAVTRQPEQGRLAGDVLITPAG